MNISIVWLRHDLRIEDNPALINACNNHDTVIPIYIYNKQTSVLGGAQKWWLHHSLLALDESLQRYGLNLVLRRGCPLEILDELCEANNIKSVYWNLCYEVSVIELDKKIKSQLLQKGVEVRRYNGNYLIEPWSIKNNNGEYFKVFTPFWKKCLNTIKMPVLSNINNQQKKIEIFTDKLQWWDLLPKSPNWAAQFNKYWQPGEIGAQKKLGEFIDKNLNGYNIDRDIPAKNATSKLSPHLHFGEISPMAIWREAQLAKLNPSCDFTSIERFLAEIGWREFSNYLLYHFPNLSQDNFKIIFDYFPWSTDENALKRWQKGETGYPLIDAGMRELWTTGYMHNRVRMIVASFLTKDLLIDWRLGAKWFLDTLVDADLASNSAGWQWVAGCGADAAPYFRIFNPILQSRKFDPDGDYIRRWVPELAKVSRDYIHQPWIASSGETGLNIGIDYPEPIVDHGRARIRALEHYNDIKNYCVDES